MGLSERKKYQFESMLIEILGKYGITLQDLIYLPEALKIVKDLKETNKPATPSVEDKKKFKEKEGHDINSYFKNFNQFVEEMYPDGKPKEKHNN